MVSTSNESQNPNKKQRIQINGSSLASSIIASSSTNNNNSLQQQEKSALENAVFEQWRSDRPLVQKLSRQNTGMYNFYNVLDDSEDITSDDLSQQMIAFENGNDSIDLVNALPVPPVKDAIGEYDVVFVRWDLHKEEKLEDRNYLISRTFCGSTLVLACSENQTSGNSSSGSSGDNDAADAGYNYDCLRGEIRLEGRPPMDGDGCCFPPYATRTRFSFSEAEHCDFEHEYGNYVSATEYTDGDERPPFVCVDTLLRENTCDPKLVGEGLPNFTIGDLSVNLMWIGKRRALGWLPHDNPQRGSIENERYVRALREKIEQKKKGNSRTESSWLYRQTPLPAPIVEKIYDYIAFLPETTEPFWIEPNDLLVDIKWEDEEFENRLGVQVVARKRK